MAQRRESVRLELQDAGFSTGMVRNAAATGLLEKALKSLDGTNVVIHERISESATQVDRLSKSSRGADRSINQLTGRIRLFADLAATLGPALVPLGGVAIAGIAGLASQMGFAAVAGGVLIGSMQGLGDALGALNDYHLEPTTQNFNKVEDALNGLSPAAADFAREAYGMLPALREIRDAGAEALFPGLTESLDDLERLAPVVARIFESVGGALGDIAADGAASLASDRWADFFDFIATEAPSALSELASTVGSLTHGLAELWMAFAPLNRDVSQWMSDAAASFDRWAAGLDQTEGFQDFISYIRETGPQVADTLGSLANAVIQIVQAAAPLGGATLAAIGVLADVIADIAGSPIGPVLLAAASAMALFSGAMSLYATASTAGLAALNPWVLAIGATAGLLLAVEQNARATTDAIDRFHSAMEAGDLDEANAGLDDMQARLDELKGTDMASITFSSFSNLLAGISVQDEIDQLEADIGRGKAAVGDLSEAQQAAANRDEYRRSIEEETAALNENIAAMQAKRDEALRSFSAQTNYSQSLLDAKKALEENGRAWNLNTEAGLKNRRVVEQQASSWNELNRTQGQTPAQARKARAALEDTAMSLGATREEARRYAKQLMDIPNQLETKIDADVNGAIGDIARVRKELDLINGKVVTTYVRTVRTGGDTAGGPQEVRGQADGGSVPKTGKPYADRHLYLLADGEEVISNRHGQADRHRSLLKDINAGRLAGGGTAGKRKASGGLFVVDQTASLEEAIRRLTLVSEGQTSALEDATARTEKWSERMADVAAATTAGFNTGLFDRDSNPWAAGAGGGPLANLARDIAGLNERSGLQSQLAGMGLSGDSLAALLGQGSNADISGLINSGQVSQYAALYAQRAALQGSVGAAGGQAAYGAAYSDASAAQKLTADAARQTNVELATLNGRLARMESALANVPDRIGAATGSAVRGEAVKGHKDKKGGRRG